MSKLVRIAPTFTNLRSSFKLGPLDVGVHSSLVQRKNGKFLLLDSTSLEPEVKDQVAALTNGGKDIDAILNLHPFHTSSLELVHKLYPHAKLYGSSRHVEKAPDLPWQQDLVDSEACRSAFSDDLDLRKPEGVDFISPNEAIHFSSMVAYHRESKTVHVDDTFSWIPTPSIAEAIGLKEGVLALHPTLPMALQHEAGASEKYRQWMKKVIADWQIDNMCFAHNGYLQDADNDGDSLNHRLEKALHAAEPVLRVHEERWGK